VKAPGRIIWILFGAVSIAFHLGLIFSGLISSLISRPLHLALALPWVLLLNAKTVAQKTSGLILTVAGTAAIVYVVANESMLVDQYGALEGPLQRGRGLGIDSGGA